MAGSDWHPEDIKAAIRKRGMTIGRLAALHKMMPRNLTLAMEARVSARSERIIAEFIGVQPHEIWPSRYDANGDRKWMRVPTHLRKAAA